MGVKYLKEIFPELLESSSCSKALNILNEIKKHKEKHGKAIIVIDVISFTFLQKPGSSHIEINLGGRNEIYLEAYKAFLDKLKRHGATLCFYCDGQLPDDKIEKWCSIHEGDFDKAKNIIEKNKKYYDSLGCKTIFHDLFTMIKENDYGEICMATKIECDREIAVFAQREQAIAVISGDSDFLIYDGSWQLWDINSINPDKMTTDCYYSSALREKYEMNSEQVKYFATIVGNDRTFHLINYEYYCYQYRYDNIAKFCKNQLKSFDSSVSSKIEKYMEKLYGCKNMGAYKIDETLKNTIEEQKQKFDLNEEQVKYFVKIAAISRSWNRYYWKQNRFNDIAEFCRTKLNASDSELNLKRIAKFMEELYGNEIDVNCIKQSIISYDTTDLNLDIHKPVECKNMLISAFSSGGIFQYDVAFLNYKTQKDEQGNEFLFVDKLIKVFKRLRGILKDKSVKPNQLKIAIKKSEGGKYALQALKPEYPKANILLQKQNEKLDEDRKWKLLLWITVMESKVREDLIKIPDKYRLIALSLKFLLKAGQITTKQANALMFSIYIISENIDGESKYSGWWNIGLPIKNGNNINEAIRAAQLFNRTFMLMTDCFSACGLTKFIVKNRHDALYFKHMLDGLASDEEKACYRNVFEWLPWEVIEN